MHPKELLPLYEQLLSRLAPDSLFEYEFSKYVYVPQAVSECRTFFRTNPKSFDSDFSKHVAALTGIEEIAFHSRIEIKNSGQILHIPMIDMGCERIENHLEGLKQALTDFSIGEFSVFNSGRSFHIYGHALLEAQQLTKFLGRILLLNLPGKEHVIDERWVGHRLMAGYCTLRWTNNNPHYKSAPIRIR